MSAQLVHIIQFVACIFVQGRNCTEYIFFLSENTTGVSGVYHALLPYQLVKKYLKKKMDRFYWQQMFLFY